MDSMRWVRMNIWRIFAPNCFKIENKNRLVLFCNLTRLCLCVFGFDLFFVFVCCKFTIRFRLIRRLDFDWCFNLLMLMGFMSMSQQFMDVTQSRRIQLKKKPEKENRIFVSNEPATELK